MRKLVWVVWIGLAGCGVQPEVGQGWEPETLEAEGEQDTGAPEGESSLLPSSATFVRRHVASAPLVEPLADLRPTAPVHIVEPNADPDPNPDPDPDPDPVLDDPIVIDPLVEAWNARLESRCAPPAGSAEKVERRRVEGAAQLTLDLRARPYLLTTANRLRAGSVSRWRGTDWETFAAPEGPLAVSRSGVPLVATTVQKVVEIRCADASGRWHLFETHELPPGLGDEGGAVSTSPVHALQTFWHAAPRVEFRAVVTTDICAEEDPLDSCPNRQYFKVTLRLSDGTRTFEDTTYRDGGWTVTVNFPSVGYDGATYGLTKVERYDSYHGYLISSRSTLWGRDGDRSRGAAGRSYRDSQGQKMVGRGLVVTREQTCEFILLPHLALWEEDGPGPVTESRPRERRSCGWARQRHAAPVPLMSQWLVPEIEIGDEIYDLRGNPHGLPAVMLDVDGRPHVVYRDEEGYVYEHLRR